MSEKICLCGRPLKEREELCPSCQNKDAKKFSDRLWRTTIVGGLLVVGKLAYNSRRDIADFTVKHGKVAWEAVKMHGPKILEVILKK